MVYVLLIFFKVIFKAKICLTILKLFLIMLRVVGVFVELTFSECTLSINFEMFYKRKNKSVKSSNFEFIL